MAHSRPAKAMHEPLGVATFESLERRVLFFGPELLPALNQQAETTTLAGGASVEAIQSGAEGTGYVVLDSSGESLTWTNVSAGPGGGTMLRFRHAIATGNATVHVLVNGARQQTLTLVPTGGLASWKEASTFVTLPPGASHAVRLEFASGARVQVDRLTLPPPTPITRPMEVFWGGYRNNAQLVGAGASKWTFVQQHMDGMLLHGAYWLHDSAAPAIAQQLAPLLRPDAKRMLETGLPHTTHKPADWPGTRYALDHRNRITDRLVNRGITPTEFSVDFHQFALSQVAALYPTWTSEEVMGFVTGDFPAGYSGPARTEPGAGWWSSYFHAMRGYYPGATFAPVNSPVHFTWNQHGSLSGSMTNDTRPWLRIVRQGNVLTTYASPAAYISGQFYHWNKVAEVTVPMGQQVFVGLAGASKRTTQRGVLYFDNVSVNGSAVAAFTLADVGSTGLAGIASGNGAGSSTAVLQFAGADIAGAADSFSYYYTSLTGDGEIIARATRQSRTDPWAKSGIMIRESLAAGSPFVGIFATPDNSLTSQHRATSGGAVAVNGSLGGMENVSDVPSFHRFSGNAFLEGYFKGADHPAMAGFNTDSPYAYLAWNGGESSAAAIDHRLKIRTYEAWLHANGKQHGFIANSSSNGTLSSPPTQAQMDAWDQAYHRNSLRALALYQLEGGRPDRAIFESWYDGPFNVADESAPYSFANLAKTGIQYAKGIGQFADLEIRPSGGTFAGGNVYQSSPDGVQHPATRVTRTYELRLTNRGTVAALPVLQAHRVGADGWTFSIKQGTTDLTAAMTSSGGAVLTDAALFSQNELIAPGASVVLTVTVQAPATASEGDLLFRAFWNPQDGTLATRDAVAIRLDNRGPAAPAAAFRFSTRHEIELTFAEPIDPATLTASDLTLTNLSTGAVLPAAAFSLVAVNDSAVSVRVNNPLDDGRWRLSLPAGSMTDRAGNPLAAGLAYDFHFFRGDMNRDGVVNNQDIAPFVQALTSVSAFESAFGYSPTLLGDVNRDGVMNNQDITGFVARLTGARPIASPGIEPTRATAGRSPTLLPAPGGVTRVSRQVLADRDDA
jgi:hypothetical protein